MKFSMTGQEKGVLLIRVTASVLKMKIWIYWSESNSEINSWIFLLYSSLKKNWKSSMTWQPMQLFLHFLHTTNTANITINDFHLFILLSLLLEFILCNGNTHNKLTIELGGGYTPIIPYSFLNSFAENISVKQ
jgi:hypothetical protein